MSKLTSLYFWTVFYYLIAKHLPVSYQITPLGSLTKKMRATACNHIFRNAGSYINIERDASLGSGCELEIGDH